MVKRPLKHGKIINNEFYDKCFRKGRRYENFIAKKLKLHLYLTKSEQYIYGDTKEGIEIKLDNQVSKTDTILMEVCEKTDIKNKDYVPSGIFRQDKCDKYIIGNRKEAYLFYKKDLINIYKKNKYKIFDEKTRMYFLLPIKDAKKIALKVYLW